MGGYLAERIAAALFGRKGARVLVLGLTFKENIPDIRNTKVGDLIKGLRAAGQQVDVHDPLADPAAALAEHGIALMTSLDGAGGYDCVVGAVAHRDYRALDGAALETLVAPGGLIFDLRDMWSDRALPASVRRVTL